MAAEKYCVSVSLFPTEQRDFQKTNFSYLCSKFSLESFDKFRLFKTRDKETDTIHEDLVIE